MSTVFDTPSKRAASSLQTMSLASPTKPAFSSPLDKFIAEHSAPEELDEAGSSKLVVVEQPQPDVEEYRTRFVGQVDLDEKDEPLLKASSRRFVLFPIQYHEVCALSFFFFDAFSLSCLNHSTHLSRNASYSFCAFAPTTTDLADVQESRGEFLDCRGDGSLQGHQ